MQAAVHFNPFDPGFQADPFAFYRPLTAAGPLHRTRLGVWVAVGYRECAAILGDSRFLRDHSKVPHRGGRYDPANRAVQSAAMAMLNLDGAAHDRIRGAFSPLFTRRNILRYQDEIDRGAQALLRHAEGADRFDLVRDFALPLATDTIKAMLGIGDCDSALIQRFTTDSVIFLEPVTATADELVQAEQSYHRLAAQITGAIAVASDAAHPLHPIRTRVDEGALTADEAAANIAFVLSAGIDTTVNLICAGYLTMAAQSVAAADLANEAVINELLRLSPSIHMTGRVAAEDVLLGSSLIKAGSLVIVAIAAGNRDPLVFSNPDAIDPHRKGPVSLGFGAGRHFCIGVHLAKLEAAIAWSHLLRHLPPVGAGAIEIEYERRAFIRTPRRVLVRRGGADGGLTTVDNGR